MRRFRIWHLLLMFGVWPQIASAATNLLYIVDSSGSMWEQVDGKPKIVVAKSVLNETLSALSPETRLGLMTYGRRRAGDCADIEVLSPIGSESRAAIAARVAGLTPKGKTPIAAALVKASLLFKKFADDHNEIVLITDGAEECRGDPCAAARQLAAAGLDLHINVVGFNLQKKERAAVECIAREGGGNYYDAQNSVGLTTALRTVSNDVQKVTPPPKPTGVNLLAGGDIAAVPAEDWSKPIDGNDADYAYVLPGQEGVYSFNGERAGTFSKFSVLIAGQNEDNPRQIELRVADQSPTGPFRSVGVFSVQNMRFKSPYQEFSFPETTARYVKIRLVSFYGHDAGGGSILPQIRVIGNFVDEPVAAPSVGSTNDEQNVLAGGRVINAPAEDWAKPIDGKDGDYAYVLTGQEGVYAFRDQKPAAISRFSVLIAGVNIDNPKEIELLASSDLPSGPFRSVGIFKIQNLRTKPLYQEFKFPVSTARFVKIRLVSFYGHDAGGGSILPQIRIMGKLAN